jgi:hypothetical protein
LVLLAANPVVYQGRPFVYAVSYISGSGIEFDYSVWRQLLTNGYFYAIIQA